MTVSRDRQCTMPACTREATDLSDSTPLCAEHLAEVGNEEDTGQQTEPDTTPRAEFTGPLPNVDLGTPESSVYCSTNYNEKQWMGARDKMPFSPWSTRNSSVKCTNDDCSADRCDDPGCDCDGRWKWGFEDHYVTGEELDMFLEDPKSVTKSRDGRSSNRSPTNMRL